MAPQPCTDRSHPDHPALPDLDGRFWAHPDTGYLIGWIARRDALLRTIAAAPRTRPTRLPDRGRRYEGPALAAMISD